LFNNYFGTTMKEFDLAIAAVATGASALSFAYALQAEQFFRCCPTAPPVCARMVPYNAASRTGIKMINARDGGVWRVT
jgi:hypothetical protein